MAFTMLPKEDIDAADLELKAAFALCGLMTDKALMCPAGCAPKIKRVEFKQGKNMYWKCHKCKSHGTATKLLQEKLSMSFPDSVNVLLGRHKGSIPKAEVHRLIPDSHIGDGFKAATEPWVWELYAAVLNSAHVSVEAAQQYYARWHINPDAVAVQQARLIVDSKALQAEMLAGFSPDKLVESGLFVETKSAQLFMLCGYKYPVIEPAIDHRGRVRNMQFRASMKQREAIAAHKNGDGKYVAPFMSIKGSGERHLIGCGTSRLMNVTNKLVYVVEGFKDLLAANTMGAEAFAMPGTGVLPPPGLVKILAAQGHSILVALDGDEAGNASAPKVAEHFIEHGFDATKVRIKTDMPDGMDVTDILVKTKMEAGCKCTECTAVVSRTHACV